MRTAGAGGPRQRLVSRVWGGVGRWCFQVPGPPTESRGRARAPGTGGDPRRRSSRALGEPSGDPPAAPPSRGQTLIQGARLREGMGAASGSRRLPGAQLRPRPRVARLRTRSVVAGSRRPAPTPELLPGTPTCSPCPDPGPTAAPPPRRPPFAPRPAPQVS